MHGKKRKKKVIKQLNTYVDLFNLTKNVSSSPTPTTQYVQLEKFRQNTHTSTTNNVNNAYNSGNVSIQKLYNQVVTNTVPTHNNVGNHQVEALSIDRLNETWRRYMRSISSTDTQLYNVMNHELSIDKNDINIKLENTHQANMIRSANELKHFLRKELKNIFIDIVPILPENVEDTTITYNNEEKLQFFIEHNSTIKTLIKELKLKFE